MNRVLGVTAWVVVLLLLNPVSARADSSMLVGLTAVEGVRPSRSWSFSHRPSTVGVEVEYLSTTPGDYSAGGIFGSLIVVPATMSRVQLFAVGGIGIWGESFRKGKGTGVINATNVGGGALVGIAGPLSLRLDYRLFRLGEVPKEEIGALKPSGKYRQRLAAGLHVRF